MTTPEPTRLLVEFIVPGDRSLNDQKGRIDTALKSLPPWLREWRFVEDTPEKTEVVE